MHDLLRRFEHAVDGEDDPVELVALVRQLRTAGRGVVSQFECRGFRKTRYTFAQRRATQIRVRRTPAQPPLTPCRQPRHHEP